MIGGKMNRYERLKTYSQTLYCEGAPITIEAYSILKDTEKEQVIAQVKFKCITEEKIKAVFINVECMNVKGEKNKGLDEIQYLDINVNRNDTFGDRKAIVLPDNSTREIAINVELVLFENGKSWSRDNKTWEKLLQQKSVDSLKMGEEFQKDYESVFGRDNMGLYMEYKDLWVCPCGSVNKNYEKRCNNCLKEQKYIVENTIESIKEKMNRRLKIESEKNAIEEKRLAEQKEIRKKRFKTLSKRIFVLGVILLGVICLVNIFTFCVYPELNYRSANKDLESKKYGKAIEKFERLNDYRDSEIKLKKAKYEMAYKIVHEDQKDAKKLLKAHNILIELENDGYLKNKELRFEALYLYVQLDESENDSLFKQFLIRLLNYYKRIEDKSKYEVIKDIFEESYGPLDDFLEWDE